MTQHTMYVVWGPVERHTDVIHVQVGLRRPGLTARGADQKQPKYHQHAASSTSLRENSITLS